MAWLVGPRVGTARMVGGVSGAMINAAAEFLTDDWVNPYAAVTGAFFGALVTGHLVSAKKETSPFAMVITSALLLAGLGVFSRGYLIGLLHPSGFAFLGAAAAAVLSIVITLAVRLSVDYLLPKPKRRRGKSVKAVR